MTDNIPGHICVRFARLEDPRDDSVKIVWFQSPLETCLDEPSMEQLRELHAAGLLHGPFTTEDEAKHDAQETLLEPDTKVFDGGTIVLGPPPALRSRQKIMGTSGAERPAKVHRATPGSRRGLERGQAQDQDRATGGQARRA
jgi:hypothetical protein